MKKKLILGIITALSAAILLVSAAIALNTSLIVKQFAENNIKRTLSLITNHLRLMDNLLVLIEDNLKQQAEEDFEHITDEISDLISSGSLNDDILENIVSQISAEEIYIIDKDATITHTTFPQDKGLSLSFNPKFTAFLEEIYGSGRIFTHRPTNSSVTGQLNSYFYFSPKHSSYIIEISYSLKKHITLNYSKKFYDTTFMLFELNNGPTHVINNIDVVSFNNKLAWSFLREGLKRSDLDTNILKEIPRYGSRTIKKNSEFILYHNIGTTLENPLFQDSIFIILNYRLDVIQTMLLQIAGITALISFITLFFAVMFFTRMVNVNLIDRVLSISSGIKELPRHGFNKKLAIKGKDELSEISENINAMSVQILDRENQLHDLKNYLNDIINSIKSLIFVVNKKSEIMLINEAACTHFNISHDDVINANIYSVLPVLKKYSNEIHLLMNEDGEFNHKEPSFIPGFSVCSISIMPMNHKQHESVIIKIDDITEIAKKDEQLLQAQKMEVIGTLAGGFAHNLNNVLSGVIGSVSLLKHRLKTYKGNDRDFFTETVSIISSSAEKAVDMSRELLSISKKRKTQFGPVDLNSSIENVIKMCSHIFDRNVNIEYTNTTQSSIIYGNTSQLEHLLLNIFVNAYHAMTIMHDNPDKRGGTVTVILSRALDEDYLSSTFGSAETEYLEISVADSGVGISEEIQAHIFDPFFSTKASQGTGLGLATVNSIVQQHEGSIQLQSKVGEGSVFSIYFPAFQSQTEYVNAAPVQPKAVLQMGSGTILIVDDEPFVLKTASTILKNAGYSIITATNGSEGIEKYKNSPDVDLVLLDMIMPGKSGKETLAELRKINPEIKAVISSGFIHDDMLDDVKKLGICGYIKKPYSATHLAKLVYEALNS